MYRSPLQPVPATHHTLRFEAIAAGCRGYVFPCNPSGQVEIDCLSDRERVDFLFARHLVGLRFQRPLVEHQDGSSPGTRTARPERRESVMSA